MPLSDRPLDHYADRAGRRAVRRAEPSEGIPGGAIRFAGFILIMVGLMMKIVTLPLSEALHWMIGITATAIGLYVVGVIWVLASEARRQRR
jgi:hypothetical protein